LDEKEHGVFECHTALLPSAKGKSTEIGKEALEWVFKNTEATKIITSVPENNPMALRMALKSGFKIYGNKPDSFLKHGKLLSQTLLEIRKD
jgi:RimJ/RimL family protein N-acetyltransferase